MNQKYRSILFEKNRVMRSFWGMLLFVGLMLSGCQSDIPVMDLSGTWQLALQTDTLILANPTLPQTFSQQATLPGTLDMQQLGTPNTDTTTMHLNRLYTFTGTAWFRKEVTVPTSWNGKTVQLNLERSKITALWIDDRYMGYRTVVSASQHYDLTDLLTPGKHTLTLAVNNNPAMHTVGGSHAYTDHTLTNWNGVLGTLELRAYPTAHIRSVQVYPEAGEKKVTVKIQIQNDGDTLKDVKIQMQAEAWNTSETHKADLKKLTIDLAPGKNIVRASYRLGDDALLWSEYHPAMYRLHTTLHVKKQSVEEQDVHFGLRDFKAGERLFTINDTPTFLRGKLESGTFPLTGYAPMDTTQWLQYYRTCKEYGINHIRFHSWTPPEAAFLAADMCGMYVQTELPNWAAFTAEDTLHTAWMQREGEAILEDFGNHASFVMFTLGNELSGEASIAEQMVVSLRKIDNRHLYAFGANNFLEDPFYGKYDDFWVTFRTGRETPDKRYDVRGSASCNEDVESGIINATYPSTTRSYDKAISDYHMPIMGHEVGQYQMYPDFNEIDKYTGIEKAWNFEVFRKRLVAAGMLDQADDFMKASGASMALLYREEVEMARRTEGFAGYQLLDLQDYPGQGTALVGILDAFMDNKGIVTPEQYRETSNDVVLLACMDKYCWTWNETFNAAIKVSYFAEQPIYDAHIRWSLVNGEGKVVAQDTCLAALLSPGELSTVGNVSVHLRSAWVDASASPLTDDAFAHAVQLCLRVEVLGTSYQNTYPLWIYPDVQTVSIPEKVLVTRQLDEKSMQQLSAGNTVVLLPEATDIASHSVGPQFINDFWNWLMFKGICESNNRSISQGTLGLLVQPSHPLFKDFPTESHTNWQWWVLMQHARPFILDHTSAKYRPIVQVIDNIDRNHKLGTVFEWKVGEGKLVVCTIDLPALQVYPEACQFYRSLLQYAASDYCNPQETIEMDTLLNWF